jgi:uncharacterized protein YegP (UPF0339 family)
MPPKFQLYKDSAGKFRFRVVAENGQTVASSEAYEHYASCIKGINSVKKNARSEVEDLTIEDRKVLNPKYQIYKDAAEEFRFRLKASNGEIIAQSEGYETKDACMKGIGVVKRSYNAKIDDSEVVGKSEEPSVRSEVGEYAKPAKAAIAEAKVEEPIAASAKVETPEVKMPEVEVPEVGTAEVKVPEVEMPEVKESELEKPEMKMPELPTKVAVPELEMPETKPVLPKVEELREKVSVAYVETEVSKEAGVTVARPKGVSVLKELLVSFVGLLIALIFSALALGIANWGIGFFGITGDVAKAAAVLAVAIVVGPTIAAFATKKYF